MSVNKATSSLMLVIVVVMILLSLFMMMFGIMSIGSKNSPTLHTVKSVAWAIHDQQEENYAAITEQERPKIRISDCDDGLQYVNDMEISGVKIATDPSYPQDGDLAHCTVYFQNDATHIALVKL